MDNDNQLPPAPVAEQPDLPLVDGYVLLPRELTAENGAKSLLMGEFSESVEMHCEYCDAEGEDCEFCDGNGVYKFPVSVGWNTIKRIYRKAAEHLAQPAPLAVELSGKPVPGVCINEDGRPALVGDGCENLMGRKPLYAHPQPAIGVDALSEFLESNGFLGYSFGLKERPQAARDLSIRICNWIEEQKQ